MYWLLQAFILLLGVYFNEAGYGHGNTNHYVTPDAQSDVEAPAYMPPYLRHQQSFGSSSGTKNVYSGTKNVYSGTKNGYSGTKNVNSGTKNVYSGTKNVHSGTKNVYGGNSGYGGGGSGYSEAREWYSNSGAAPNYQEFFANANEKYQPKCEPECKNTGICVKTNTCECPANYHGTYCEFEKKQCLSFPPLPMNSYRHCSSELCTITCMEGHKFIDGSTVANMRCAEGEWTPSRADLSMISDCQPECTPPCLNGGACLALNTCQCPAAYRGPQCQYSETACEVRKLAFNGGYKCTGDEATQKCTLSCPAGSQFSVPPADIYTCRYDSGVFQPQPIPHCVFTDIVVITPTNEHNNTFYSYHSESHSGYNETFTKNHYGGGYGGSSHYGGGGGGASYGGGGGGASYGGGGGGASYGGGSTHYGSSGSVHVILQDMTPKGGTCLTWAGVHYKTFDGMVYTFQSPCQHILVRDPIEHKYSVAIKQSECKRRGYCPSELTVYLEEKPYILAVSEDGSVLFRSTKRLIPIPASLPGIRVSMPGDYVVVNLDAVGVAIKWDTNNLVQVEGSVLLWNNTEGLCGVLDGNPSNDLMTREGQVVQSKSVIASSWKLNKIGDICETSPTETAACATETADDVTKAAKFCNELISMKKFHKCSKVMDVLQFLEACKWDYCACTKTLNPEECACNAISVYAKECLRHGVEEMKNWRDADICPMKCPDGKLYKSCGSDTQPSCAFPMTPSKPENVCVEGCFCPPGLFLEGGKCVQKKECPCRTRNKSFPPGSVLKKDCNTCSCEGGEWVCTKIPCGARCRAVGDPHYTTFDGLRYDFMGHCTYTMLQAENLTVFVENVACSGAITEAMNLTPYKGEGKPSCTKAITLNYGGASIHLKQGGNILANGKEINTLPVLVGDVRIRAASSLFLIVQLPNKVDLWWDGNTRVFIDVPPSFHDKTKGLCGTFNLNQKDDFLTPENDIEQSTLAFANKWKTRELCSDEDVTEPEHPCKANLENKEAAEKYCGMLKGKIFEECHWHVDVEPYYESCVYDMCACAGDAARCLCPALGDYATSCAKAGVMLQWRYNVKECELSCTGGQEYTVCADSCLRKCSDSAFTSATCEPRCVEGCACAQGQLLDDSGVCVPVALCPCFHKGLEFKAGYKEVRPGRRERELCTCVGARWDCTPATPEEIQNYPPAEDLRSNCSATPNMEFTTCAKTEHLTCKNMHLAPSPLAAECRPGCQCSSGYVLDTASSHCVRPAQCPCHHGGTSYPDGHKMQEECNECECKSGNWSCTTRKCAGLCSAWGDSHMITFDGTDYDFEGVCTYLLAKGMMDGHDGFDVEIQNVPCGTTGATCSKSITLKVGSGNDEEIVSLTRDTSLPDISKLKRIKLRIAGAYVFLDVPSLGMSLQWDRRMRVYVKVDSMWRGRVKGLCGNYNGDMRDDFQTPSGGGLSESSPLIFADSWKLKPTCPKAQRIINHCKQRPERKEWAATTCGALKRYPFTLCHTEVPPGGFLDRCEKDACACDAGGDCECACAALAEYAYACAHRGVTFNWRTQDMCPMQCDEECSNYNACVPACPIETCDNTLYYSEIKTNCEQDTCVEGCKPKKACPVGQVYKNSSTIECVPIAKCKPTCLTLENGTEIGEGEVMEQDDCHTCRCSKHQKICTGQPCVTGTSPATESPTSPKPNDQGLQCVTGWTPWISRGGPETESNGHVVENEPLPKPNELHIGSPMCKPDRMTGIECRTIGAHKSAKDTGLDVECSLERGLVCRDKKSCPDFEIRVHCQCASPNPCLNDSQSVAAHPTDCSRFIECSPEGPVDKQCGPGTLFNPNTLVCDWPAAVKAVKPECRNASEATTTSTTQSATTTTTTTTPTTPTAPITSPPAVCPPGQVYSDCAYPCDKLCDYFKKTMMNKGECAGEKCVKGCIDRAVASIQCDYGSYWRDEKTCVPKKDCTCLSEVDNQIVKPGGVIVDGCLQCQCLDNDFHCDSTECVAVVSPVQGSTHQPLVVPRVINTASTPEFIPPDTTTSTSKPPTKEPRLLDTTRMTLPESDTTRMTLPELYTETPVPKEPIIIVKPTVTPPPECTPDNYIDLMWGDEPLPHSSFSASSVASALFEPQFAQLNGHSLDITAGSWNPSRHDVNQYIQVELPRREPVYGVILQGSPIFDQYVTSYEVLYGDDGVVFHAVEEGGQPKVFRGPVDNNVAMKQMLSPPVEAKFFRIHPLTWHDEIAIRMELIGCQLPSNVVTTTAATTLEPLQCTEPLGIAADLPLDSITVSSNQEEKKHLTLDGDRGWRPLYSTPGEWIMFNFTSPRNITGIKTKGGLKGWVTTYKVLFTSNLDNFNPILNKDGKERLFPANFDKVSEAIVEFRPPIQAQYLKVLPMKWQDAVELRAEPIGCFEPYPTPAPTVAPTTEMTTPSTCKLCPGVPAPESGCACAPEQYYDGENCVSRPQCPCVISFMSYPVGSTFRGANCDECVCKLGGVTSCAPVKECKCEGPINEQLVPKLLPSTCECVCEPCPTGTKVCPHGKMCLALEKWCDGLQNCPDDELDCSTQPPVTEPPVVTTQAVTAAAILPTTTVKPQECPVVACPPGYKVQYKATRPNNPYSSALDLPPPRPRYSYQRYYKGGPGGGYTKTGFSKGGFSKGGFSKGGYSGFSPPVKPSQPFTLDKPAIESTAAPSAEICPQFACVPPVPPFPRPGATPAPVVCSVVTCPPGYTLKLETLKGFNKCPQYECVPPPERPSFCNVTGRTFNTFDGSEYKYDVCFHILARENRFNTWTVVVRKKCRAEGCWNELLISQDDQLILVKPNMMIEYDNYEYSVEQTSKICFQKNSFDIARLGDGVSIKSRKYNFTVLFSKEGDIKIGVLKKHMGTVDGLCGAYDGDKVNDRRLPDGNLATSIDQFGRAWGKPGMAPDACQARVVEAAKQKRVWDLCNVITKEPLARCGEMLNLDKWRSICLEKICECTELVVNGSRRSEEECRCILLQQMVAECLAADGGVDLAAWRLMMDCPAECPAPLVHYDCFRRRCEPACEATGVGSQRSSCDVEEGSCYPGCYCPEGTLRKGDDCVLPDDCLDCTCNGVGTPAKYVTFEGDDLPFLCNCTYLASRDRNATGQHKYQIFATNAPCEDNPSAMCTKSIHLAFEKKVIHVSRNPETQKLLTTVGDTALYNLPLKEEWGAITLDNRQDITITLFDSRVELKVFASKMEFKVNVPSSVYANKTEGLCGVCAGYQDALITSNGTATDSFEEYGKSWQATPDELTTLSIPPQEQCDQPPPVEECTPPPAETNPCYNLYNADRFGACHALVDPEPFVHSCEADLCLNATDSCATFERYSASCRAQGVCLEHWRTDLCPYPCDAPLIYRACVDCERTCENFDQLAANPKKCDKQPVEGCFCPEGKVRVNNTCIAPTKCFPCDANKEHFAGDEWQTNACTKCTCSKLVGENQSHVSCTTESCTTPVCASAEDMVTEPARPGLCCPTYVCVPKPKTASCVEPKKMECGYGQVLKQKTTAEGCKEFACECKPASECETIPPDSEVEMFEPGMTRVIDHSGCCPRAELLCRVASCPTSPACPQFHDLLTKNDTTKCCPEYSCELPKDKCLVRLEWEAAARGGEKSRTTPQVLFKDRDSVWLDGPCRSCRCEQGPSGASPQCSVTECAAILSTEQFVVEPRPVPFACCPLPEQVACRDRDNIYKVGENWTATDDVCTQYKCIKNEDGQLERVTTVQNCDDKCQPGWEYQAPPAGQCCGKCAPAACVVQGKTHKIGTVWNSPDHCANFTCVNHNGTLQIQSSNETCPEVSKALRKQFVLKEEKVEGKCCPKVEAIACRVGNKIYQEGQTWQSKDPCKNVTCARESGALAAQVVVESCADSCAVGWLYAPPGPDRCCGRCLEDACVIGDQLKKPGTIWRSADNCTAFSCERAGETVYVTSSRQTCPDVASCPPEYLRKAACCPVCEEPAEALSKCVPQDIPTKETIGLVRKHLGAHGVCANKQPITGFKECRGTCDSGALYDKFTGVHSTACECCSAIKFSSMEVSLDCDDGSQQPHQLATPDKCACRPCGGSGANYWGTKSGHSGIKSPHPQRMIMTTPAPAQPSTEKEDENEFIPNIYQRFGETN